jgi:hypothetical protein
VSNHINYPHEPGSLYGCFACEDGPCVCDGESFGCVSSACVHGEIPFILDEDDYVLFDPYDRLEDYDV